MFPSHCPVLITHLPRTSNRNQYEARLLVLACRVEQVVQVRHFAFEAKVLILSPVPRVLRKDGDERLPLPAAKVTLNRHKQDYFAGCTAPLSFNDVLDCGPRPRATYATARVHHDARRRGVATVG
jgi:hypothetical protein